jgi:RNA polymerase sigma factor (sigma-70 family)
MDDLYARHVHPIVRLAYLMTGDRQTAGDIAQEAFIKTFGRWRHLRQGSSFETYLRTTVVNLVRSHFRHRSVERLREAPLDSLNANARPWSFATTRSSPKRRPPRCSAAASGT